MPGMKKIFCRKMGTQVLSIYDQFYERQLNDQTISLETAKNGIVLQWVADPTANYRIEVTREEDLRNVISEEVPKDRNGLTGIRLDTSGSMEINILSEDGTSVASGRVLIQRAGEIPVSIRMVVYDFLGNPIMTPIDPDTFRRGLQISWERNPRKTYRVSISYARGDSIFESGGFLGMEITRL